MESQVELFAYCWENKPHRCYVTDQKLDRWINTPFAWSMFAHVLRKSAYPEWRLEPNNIVLLSPNYEDYSVHRLFDDGVMDEIEKFEKLTGKSFRVLFEFERDQHVRYVNEHGRKVPERKVVKRYLG